MLSEVVGSLFVYICGVNVEALSFRGCAVVCVRLGEMSDLRGGRGGFYSDVVVITFDGYDGCEGRVYMLNLYVVL